MRHDEYAQINGLNLHYVREGDGDKVILFLHGFPEFWYMWRNQLTEFGQDHTAIAMDMRGYNLSDKPAHVDDYAMPNLIADVRAMLDRFAPGKKSILVAHDWGGGVAWAFALAHPEYLEKLIIINCPHPAIFARELKNNPAQQKASAYTIFFRSEAAEPALSENNYARLAKVVFDAAAKPDAYNTEDRAAYLAAWSQPGALTGGLNYYRASKIGLPAPGEERREPRSFGDMNNLIVHVPTLVIWGEQDTALLPPCLDGMESFIPDLRVRRIPAGSHWVVHEEPALVNQHIAEFIR
ncbi:MAG: alpha/beta fold hydrolase [Blastocatellia bacterium]